jgi:hypothetical protein
MPINRTSFFAAVRKSLFGGVLTQSQVDGMAASLDAAPSGIIKASIIAGYHRSFVAALVAVGAPANPATPPSAAASLSTDSPQLVPTLSSQPKPASSGLFSWPHAAPLKEIGMNRLARLNDRLKGWRTVIGGVLVPILLQRRRAPGPDGGQV